MVVAQFDIKGVYIPECPLQETLYVKDKDATGNRVWRLRKSLYGTKQAAHNSNQFIDDLLKGLGFQQCKDDAGLYFRIADGTEVRFLGMDIGWSSNNHHNRSTSAGTRLRYHQNSRYPVPKRRKTPCLPTPNHSKRW